MFYLFKAINAICLFVFIYFSVVLLSCDFSGSFCSQTFMCVSIYSSCCCLVLRAHVFRFYFLGQMLFSNNKGKHLWCCSACFHFVFVFFSLVSLAFFPDFDMQNMLDNQHTIFIFHLALMCTRKTSYLHNISMFQFDKVYLKTTHKERQTARNCSTDFVALNYVVSSCLLVGSTESIKVSAREQQ